VWTTAEVCGEGLKDADTHNASFPMQAAFTHAMLAEALPGAHTIVFSTWAVNLGVAVLLVGAAAAATVAWSKRQHATSKGQGRGGGKAGGGTPPHKPPAGGAASAAAHAA
jgi:hypothetical protein